MYKKILIANDGSPGAERALSAAIALAVANDAELHMISVEDLARYPASLDDVVAEENATDQRFGEVIKHARLLAAEKKIGFHVTVGQAVPSIVDFVNSHGIDLLVLGYMGHSAIYNRLIGGTTDRLVNLAPCSVLVVK